MNENFQIWAQLWRNFQEMLFAQLAINSSSNESDFLR